MSHAARSQLDLPLEEPDPADPPPSRARAPKRRGRAGGDQPLLPFPPPERAASREEGTAAAAELARRLSPLLREPVTVELTDNRRTMISWRRKPDAVAVRLHRMFVDAPEDVLDAVARWIRRRDRRSSAAIDQFVRLHREQIRRRTARTTPRRTEGEHHDLAPIARELSERFFGGAVDAGITWGRRGKRRGRRQSIRLGSYSPEERLIRIHPALDQAFVPRYFVEWIVYHEMLHHVLGTKGTGRGKWHTQGFRALERAFPDYERAAAWEKRHLKKLLRS